MSIDFKCISEGQSIHFVLEIEDKYIQKYIEMNESKIKVLILYEGS